MNGRRGAHRAAGLGLAAILTLGASTWALAFVNPAFTPQDLEAAATAIFTAKLAAVEAGDKGAELEVGEHLKGKPAAKKLRLDFGAVLAGDEGPETVAGILKLLRAEGDRPALVAAGEFEGKRCALMHFAGRWARLAEGQDPGSWEFEKLDESLDGTFCGGTDMLVAALRFIRKFPAASVMAVKGDAAWSRKTRIGRLPGAAAELRPVDANADGRLDIFAACPEGDRLFLQGAGGKFEELPGAPGSASLAAAWADFDGDGRPDLASLGRDGLRLRLQTAAGKFTEKAVAGIGRVGNASPTVWVVDVGGDGRPDLVVGAGPAPLLLRNRGAAEFEAPRRLLEPRDLWGPAGPCVAVDLDGDGLADVVQTYRKGGAFLRGRTDGGFELLPDCGAFMGEVDARRACVADLDGDGLLDILLVGGGRTPLAFQNRGGGRFEEVMRLCGEPGYVVQADATCAALADSNNDTFVDWFVGQGGGEKDKLACTAFFSRGFRSLAIDKGLSLGGDALAGLDRGQTAAAWADLDADGAPELVLALAGGDVFVLATDLAAGGGPLCVRVPAGKDLASAAPQAVRFYRDGHCLGARLADRWGGPALLGVREAAVYAVRFRSPDGREVEREIEAGEGRPAEAPRTAAPARIPPARPAAEPASAHAGRAVTPVLAALGAGVLLVAGFLAIRRARVKSGA